MQVEPEIAVAKVKTRKDRGAWGEQPLAFTIRGCDEWKEAVAAMAKSLGMDVTVLIDASLREFARKLGRPDLPDRLK